MPEIKHEFTGGRMNKDLDERLVPNGEYRDAMNIKVSTSDGSDVGTVQNILGNSLVPGQGFIVVGADCVGSISDEKNDKLYYFVSQKPFFKSSFERNGEDWTIDAPDDTRWVLTVGNRAMGSSDNGTAQQGDNGYIRIAVPEIQEGKSYTMTYDIVTAVQNDNGSYGSLILANHTTYESELNSTIGSNNVYLSHEDTVGTHSVDWVQGPNRVGEIVLWNGSVWLGSIDNISIKEKGGDVIVEYNSKNNSTTPVLVDLLGGVLEFSPDRLITGINIIDGMLFWTDNYSEPKKINIQRCIDGTSASGTIHTNFINEALGIVTPIKKDHITVIKKPPPNAMGLGFLDPLDRDGKVFSGKIITTTIGATGDSFIFNETQNNDPYDFTGINKDDVVTMTIPFDEDGNSGFELDWKEGDVLVFKEFDEDGVTPPTLPLSTWTARGVIQPWSGNKFKDTSLDVLTTGNFNTGSPNHVANWSFDWDVFSTMGF